MADDRPAPLVRRVLEDIRKLSAGDPEADLIGELYGGWIRQMPGRVEALRDALAAGDLATVERQAHGLHGTSASLGLAEVDARALAVEEEAARRDPSAAARALDLLEAAVGTAREALAALPEFQASNGER